MPRIITTLLVYAFCVRALGIDYGKRRIGLALSDATGLLARPWKTIPADPDPVRIAAALAAEIAALIAEEDGLAAVALGYPRRLSGEPTDVTAVVKTIAALLQPQVGVPSCFRMSGSAAARRRAFSARHEKDWRKRKRLVDAAAAAVILQDYLDERTRTARHTEGGTP